MKYENIRPWRPGESGNPNGRPRDALPRALREKLRGEVRRAAEFLLYSKEADLRRIVASKNNSDAIEVWIARGILGAMRRGDFMVIARLMDFMTGGPPTE